MKLQDPFKFFKEQSGQTLIQTLVSIGLVGILATVIMTMTTNLNRENQALSEKLAAMELQQLMISTLANGSVCSTLGNGKSFTISSSGVVSPASIDLGNVLPMSNAPGAPAIATVGEKASPISNSLIVKSIQLTDIKGAPGLNQFAAKLQVNFDSTKTLRPIKPATVSTVIFTSGSTIQTIKRCTGTGSGSYLLTLSFLDQYNTAGLHLKTTCNSLTTSLLPLDFYSVQGACARYCVQSCGSGCNGNNVAPPPYETYTGGTAVGCDANSVWCQCIK